MEKLGVRMKKIRQTKRLSVKEAAKRAGVAASTYREWEYGRAIRGEPYVNIAKALEVSLHELLTGKRTEPFGVYQKLRVIEQTCEQLRIELESLL
jgi:transcriptional regulator with XRE-family HTH domain